MTPPLSIIVSVGRDGAIGRRGDLAFHISADLKRFKALTTGHTVVMGRRTFESLPKGALPNRRNIVITTDPAYTAPGIEVVPSLEAALEAAAGDRTFIIGGVRVYAEALPLADELYLTLIDADTPDADTFFPVLEHADWEVVDESQQAVDERSAVPYKFVTLRRMLY